MQSSVILFDLQRKNLTDEKLKSTHWEKNELARTKYKTFKCSLVFRKYAKHQGFKTQLSSCCQQSAFQKVAIHVQVLIIILNMHIYDKFPFIPETDQSNALQSWDKLRMLLLNTDIKKLRQNPLPMFMFVYQSQKQCSEN